MDFRHSQPIRVISVIILFFFCWTFGGIFDIAYAIKNSDQQSAISNQQKENNQKSLQGSRPAKKKPEEKFQKTIEDIEKTLTDTTSDTDTKKNKIKTKKSEIESLDIEIKKQFAETEKYLKEKGLPPEILDRHYKFVRHYEDNLNELKTNLDAIQKHSAKSKELSESIDKTKRHLEKVKAPSKHKKLDPNKLPHRTAEPVWIEPRTTPEQFLNDSTQLSAFSGQQKKQKPLEPFTKSHFTKGARLPSVGQGLGGFSNNGPILVASAGSLNGLLTRNPEPETQNYIQVALADPPTDADLAETIEVKFTPAIRAKAEELGRNPVRIYNWVRSNIDFSPTFGSIQGADMCLQTKQCNSIDTASLLIALLRASGIHARYVYGTIELPIEKVKNWVGGFTDSNAALTLIASGGIPVTGLTSSGKIAKVLLEHTWVEANISYGNYRGAMRDDSIKTWIPMDGSFKQYTYKEPMDFPSAAGFNVDTFMDEVQSGSTIDPVNSSISNVPQDLILQRMQEYVQSVHQYYDTNLQDKTIEDVIGSKKVIAKEYPYLLGSLPYKTIVVGNKYSQLPDSFRWKINFKVSSSIYSIDPDFSYTASTAFLAAKSITLSYRPSTSADETLVQKYGYIETVPPYLLNLTPELIIGGEVKASGIPVGSGNDIDFIMTFISPKGSQDVITNKETAGAYFGIGLDLSWLSKALLENKINTLNQIYNEPSPNPNRKIQEGLSLLAAVYFAEVDAMNIIGERFAKIVDIRQPSVGIIGEDLSVSYLFGMPLTLSFAGLFIDVDRDIHSTQARDGDINKVITFNILSGFNSSAMEHTLWEQLYSLPGVSAIKIFKYANEIGIPTYKIDASNISSILPLLQVSQDVKNDITNAVNAGKIVYIPKSNVQYYGWNGTAYIVMDPNNGRAGYIISQGLSGGGDARDERWWDCTEALLQIVDLIPYKSIVLSAAIDHVAFALSLSDIGRSGTDLPTKGKTALVAYINLIVGTAALHPRLGKSVGFVMAVMVVEVILWANMYRLNEGKWPILEENPAQECFDVYCEKRGDCEPGVY